MSRDVIIIGGGASGMMAALAAAVGGPLVKLNGTIARLSAMLEHVLHRLDMLEGEDRNLRRKWEETQCQLGGRVSHCENRLSLLEQKGGAYESH
mgnify:CR=1 FL=1